MGANQSHDPDGRPGDRTWHRDRPVATGQGHRMARDRLHAKDQEGSKKSRAKPSPPQRPRATKVGHNSVTLTWSPPRHPASHVLAYTVEVTSTQSRQWKTLTSACQGIHYEARYLQPDTEYSFRVRAENVYGVGKHSMPSEAIVTKEYDTGSTGEMYHSQPQQAVNNEPSAILSERKAHEDSNHQQQLKKSATTSTLQRRHSFSVHLDGRVSSILSNSDMVLNRSFPVPAASTLQRTSRAGSERSQTMTRSNFSRTSLPSSRKVSLPILLPGTGTNSVNRLRESRNSLRGSTSDYVISASLARDPVKSRLRESRSSLGSSVSDVPSSLAPSDDNNRKRDSRDSFRSSSSDVTHCPSRDGGSCSDHSRDEGLCDCSTGTSDVTSSSENNNTSGKDWDLLLNKSATDAPPDDETDAISQLKHNLKNLELTEEKLKFHNLSNRLKTSDSSFSKSDSQKGYYDSLENPWERDTSPDGVSQRIMTAPFCDDIKMALCARSGSAEEAYPGFPSANHSGPGAGQEAGDFRTLQRVLQSNSMIVRASRASASDIVGVVMNESGHPAHLMRRGPLTTIPDEEEEDPVRVTTL